MPQIPKPKRLTYYEMLLEDGKIRHFQEKTFLVTANIGNPLHYKHPQILVNAWNVNEMFKDKGFFSLKEDYPNNHIIYIYKDWKQLP